MITNPTKPGEPFMNTTTNNTADTITFKTAGTMNPVPLNKLRHRTAAERLLDVLSSIEGDYISFVDAFKKANIPANSITMTLRRKGLQSRLEADGWMIGYREHGSKVRSYFIRGEAAANAERVDVPAQEDAA
jgi:hypothetical protein